ncbi:Conserved_hypothetical protein [Hexamita inflata]|uniref:Uncharacterized protein n=1 Tax=Hexamita inflata TaxID=28002 RepID=A0AA86QUG0_9EUKA|nr:Conserved hypothetical protein [Hexamita inflata]
MPPWQKTTNQVSKGMQTERPGFIKEFYLYDDGTLLEKRPICLPKVGDIPQQTTIQISVTDIKLPYDVKLRFLDAINRDIDSFNIQLQSENPEHQLQKHETLDSIDPQIQVHLRLPTSTSNFTDISAFVKNSKSKLKHDFPLKMQPEPSRSVFISYLGRNFQQSLQLLQLELVFTHQRRQYVKNETRTEMGRKVTVKKFVTAEVFLGFSKISCGRMKNGSNICQIFDCELNKLSGEFTLKVEKLKVEEEIDAVRPYDVYVMRKFERILDQRIRERDQQTLDLVNDKGNTIELAE